MTPSETLTRAADLIRDTAAAAEPGPWGSTSDDNVTWFGRNDPETGQPLTTIAGLYHGKRAATGRWIALMSPAVAPAIESILREAAESAARHVPVWQDSSVDGLPAPKRTAAEVSELVEHHYGAALALARAVLGEKEEQ